LPGTTTTAPAEDLVEIFPTELPSTGVRLTGLIAIAFLLIVVGSLGYYTLTNNKKKENK
jgi:hypothetical protein